MQLIGKVVKVGKLETFSDKFSKVVVLVEQQDVKYDAVVPLEVINKNIEAFAMTLKEGDSYTFNINIAGREWNDKHFVSLRAWKCEPLDATPTGEAVGQTDEDKAGLPF